MMRIELYVDREDRLTLDVYSSINSDNPIQQLKGRMCYDFIKELCSSKITNITSTNEDVTIKSNDFIFTVNEYRKTFQKNGTKVIQNTIANYLSKEKLKQVKPKKVQRKNKHTGTKLLVGALVTSLLISVIINPPGDDKDEVITEPSSGYTQTVIDNSDELRIPEGFIILDNNYYSKHDGSLVFSSGDIVDEKEFNEWKHALVTAEGLETKPTKTTKTTFSPDTTFVSLDYEDRTNSEKAQITRAYYGDAIKKYSEMYGVDYELMVAIATQERGVHSETRDAGGAIGLFQIENIWNNEKLTAYNYETKEYETITVDENKLSDVFYNIKVGCMVFQTALNYMNYNIPAAIQCYNMGYGNMQKILNACSNATGKSVSEILSDQTNLDWLKYRNKAVGGDKNYLENVSSYMDQNTEINICNGDEEINMNIKRKI